MTQKRRKADNRKAIGETTALRWEPTMRTVPRLSSSINTGLLL